MIGVQKSLALRVSHKVLQFISNIKHTSFFNIQNMGLAILENYLMNCLQKPICLRKDCTSHAQVRQERVSVTSILTLSTLMPLREMMCPKTLVYSKVKFFKVRNKIIFDACYKPLHTLEKQSLKELLQIIKLYINTIILFSTNFRNILIMQYQKVAG